MAWGSAEMASARQGGGFEAVRMIGDRWSERSQHLRDSFTRNRIPLRFYDADTTEVVINQAAADLSDRFGGDRVLGAGLLLMVVPFSSSRV